MDGLECGEILFSELERSKRIDAEFYKKQSLEIAKLLDNISAKPLTNLVKVSDGNHTGISEKFIYEGIPYYRGQDIHNFFIEDSNPICIDEETFNANYMHRSHLKKDDILLSIVGTIGEVAMVTKDDKATCNCKLAILRPYDKNKSALIAIYLKTKYGFDQIDKFKRGVIQMGYLLEDMNQILIPDFSKDFENLIGKTIERIKTLTQQANTEYAEAEKLLEQEIGIDISKITDENISVKSFTQSFCKTDRLDAEYYKPKFDKLIEAIESIKHKKLIEIVNIKKSIEPGSEAYKNEGIPFIRISDISKFEITEPDKYLETNGKYDNSNYYLQKDEILFSKDGSIGIAYKVKEDAKIITSSALLHLTVKSSDEVLPDYLSVVLNSEIVKLQAERDSGGSIIKHWNVSEIEEVLIPILDLNKQKEVASKAQKSFELREKSKILLTYAKEAVEIAIEKNENEAINCLKDKMSE